MSTKVRRPDGGYATFPNRWIDAGYMAKAPGSVTQVYMFLCRWADNSTLAAAQPMRLIAKKCGLSEDIARKAVRTLESWGAIEREQESGPNAVNVWTLLMLQQQAPDYPDKLPPKLSTPPESGPPQSQGPYQPTDNQPEDDQPEEVSMQAAAFEVFWRIYPRKIAKEDARRAWRKVPYEIYRDVVEALDKQINVNWQGKDKTFIPHPATWINGKRWEDDIEPPSNSKPKPMYYKPNGGLTAEGMAAKVRGEIE